jgi:hypothetical protein
VLVRPDKPVALANIQGHYLALFWPEASQPNQALMVSMTVGKQAGR